MPVVEKNDVDVERLFSWSKEVELDGSKKKIKVHIRLLGDADLNRARIMALRNSAELRKALKDEDSNERLAFIPFKEELPREVLLSSVIALHMRELTQQVVKEMVFKAPKEPGSEATTEELEKYQEEVDTYPKRREEEIRKKLDVLIEKQRENLEKESDEYLYQIYLGLLIKELCDQELLKKFKEYSVFFGTYADKNFTKKFFNTFDDFDNLPTSAKDMLITEYLNLEIDSQDLKK